MTQVERYFADIGCAFVVACAIVSLILFYHVLGQLIVWWWLRY